MPCFLPAISSSCRTRSVSIRPGMIWLTRILEGASSIASVFASADTDARNTVDSPRFGIGSLTEAEVDIRMAPPPRACIERHRGPHHPQRTEQQQLRRILPCRIVERDGGAGRRPARIGEQQIDAAEPPRGLVGPAPDRVGRAHVHRHREDVAPDARGGGGDRLLVARGDRDLRPFTRQRLGHRKAKPAARAGHHRDFALQAKIHRVSPCLLPKLPRMPRI